MQTQNTNIFYIKKKIIFPNCTIKVQLESPEIRKKIDKGEKVLAYPIKSFIDVFFYKNSLATLTEILDIAEYKDSVRLDLKGISRVKLKKIDKLQYADFVIIRDIVRNTDSDIFNLLRKKTQELIFLINVKESAKLIKLMDYLINVEQMADFVSNYFILDFKNRYRLYKMLDLEKRSKILIKMLDRLITSITNKKNRELR